MRSLLSFVVLLFAAVVAAVSTTGNRLLVLADNVDSDKLAYGAFLADLRGIGVSGLVMGMT